MPGVRHAAIASTGYLAAYVALEAASFIHDYKGIPVTPWNPGLGAVFAFMLARGARYSAILFVGVIAAELLVLRSDLASPIVIGLAAAIAGGYGAVAYAVRRAGWMDIELRCLRDVAILLGTGCAGAILVAGALVLLLWADAKLDLADALAAAEPLLVGDVIGIAVVTPLTLRFLLRPTREWSPPNALLMAEFVGYVVAVAAVLGLIASAPGTDGRTLFYVLFLPAMIAALRHGVDGACIGLAVIQIGLVIVLHRHGYDAAEFTAFQVLMLVLTATALIVGVTVSERREADRAARAARAQLREKETSAAQAARHNLVSGMAAAVAHEINQPMTAARALARSAQEILRLRDPDLVRADKNLASAVAQIDHAGAVVQRMRELLRRGRPHVSTLAVTGMLHDALMLVRADTSERGIRLELDVPEDLPVMHGDSVQLQQVILNLVRNAVDSLVAAGTADAAIRIAAWSSGTDIVLSVRDNGPGLAPGAAERIFEPLTTSKANGLGLGLSICASIVESHGGRIWLDSSEAGATEFRVTLPLQSRPLP